MPDGHSDVIVHIKELRCGVTYKSERRLYNALNSPALS
jgi:hypothetical protein